MKRKIILLGSMALVIAAIFVYFWPMSFAMSDNATLLITITDLSILRGQPLNESTDYRIEPNQPRYEEIKQIIARYSYRRSWQTFVKQSSIGATGTDVATMMSIGSFYGPDMDFLVSSYGSGEILMDRAYRIVGGRRANQRMMRELRTLLEESEDIQPWQP